MKKLFLLFLIVFSLKCYSQKYLLFDRGWERPAFFTDSITKKMKEGFFPIYKNEFDSLLVLLDPFRRIGKLQMKRTYLNSDDFKTEHLTFKITTVQAAYGEKYDIDIISNTEAGDITLRFSNSQLDDYKNKGLIHAFFSYLDKTKKEIEKKKVKGL